MPPERQQGAAEQRLRDAIDRGKAGDKVPMRDPAAAPLGTDDEAAGQRPSAERVEQALRQETGRSTAHSGVGRDANSADHNRLSVKPLLAMALVLGLAALLAWWLV